MKKLFLDTNIILDLLGERNPFYIEAAQLVTLADLQKIEITASPQSFATVNYFLTKYENREIALEKLRKFKVICKVCETNEKVVEMALNSDFKDFEDAMQYFCAVEAKADFIITRNAKDFKHSQISILSAHEFLQILS